MSKRGNLRVKYVAAVLGIGACLTGQAFASDDVPVPRQSLDDAWWTGPIIANSPTPLPRGHAYIESYAYDVHTAHADGFGSQTFMLYGLADRVTVGVIPSFGYTRLSHGASSSRIGVGDFTLHAQYAVTKLNTDRGIPGTAIAIEESLPTGKYNRLRRESDGFGAGVHTTTLAFYAQDVFWLPNGRILRSRINLSRSFSGQADVSGLSVYGTSAGFRGRAKPGPSFAFDNAWEYSLTKRWALAVDVYYRRFGKIRVSGSDSHGVVHMTSGPSDTFAIAPAVEYSWSPNLGILIGTRVIPDSLNTTASVTPVIALSAFL